MWAGRALGSTPGGSSPGSNSRSTSLGDFDEGLAAIDPRDVQVVEAGRVTLVVSVEGEDAKRLERIEPNGPRAWTRIVTDLVRNA
jgi:hypothetical protein